MDVLIQLLIRGRSFGIGRKPTADAEISRSAAPRAGRVTTTRALGFGCHSNSERSLHVQPKVGLCTENRRAGGDMGANRILEDIN